jgi:GMP synthase-like glutamine amidotransferase
VQFHPESIMTQQGKAILANFLALADDFRRRGLATAAPFVRRQS